MVCSWSSYCPISAATRTDTCLFFCCRADDHQQEEEEENKTMTTNSTATSTSKPHVAQEQAGESYTSREVVELFKERNQTA